MGQMIELIASNGFSLSAYKAEPQANPQAPSQGIAKGGLVIVQEIFGVNHHIRTVADRFAALGYLAIAPAVFDRVERGVDLNYTAADVEQGRAIRAKVSMDAMMLDVQAAIHAAQTAGKVAVVGYCLGGTLAYGAAMSLSGLTCAVGYYGGGIAAMANQVPKVPTLLHFGEKDHGIPLSDVAKIQQARPELLIYLYPAEHGFSCDERASYDKPSADLALERTLAFLATHLA